MVWSVFGVTLVILLLSDYVTSMYLDKPIQVETRDPESVPYGLFQDENEQGDLSDDDMRKLSQYFQPQKRYLCRRYFVYNPVKGRCIPSLMALRTMRTKSVRSFPNPQAWAKMP